MENVSTTVEPFSASTDAGNSSLDDRYLIEFSPYFVVLNIVYYAVLGPVAIIGNILSVAVSQRILRYRQSIPDMLTGVLAAIDLLCVLSTHTPAVISMAEGRWTGGSAVCSYQYFMAWSCLKTSFFIIILLTIDRFLALVKPFYYRAKVTLRQMKIALLALTIFSFSSTSVTIIWFSNGITLLPYWYLCMNSWGKDNQYYSYILAFYGLTFIIGVIVFNVCNTGIVCSLLRHNRKSQRMRLRVLSAAQDRRERRVAKVIETLSALFMLFWMPYLVSIVLHQTKLFYSKFVEDLSIRVLFANTLLNPVIYGLFNRTYRKAYIYFVRKLLYFALCGQIKKPEVWTGKGRTISRESARREKSSPERKIFYLRRSYLQHRYARKTPSNGHGAPNGTAHVVVTSNEVTNGRPVKPSEINGFPPADITRVDITANQSLNDPIDFALDNIGFTLDSEEDPVGGSEDGKVGGLETTVNNGSVKPKNGYSDGQSIVRESMERENRPGYATIVSESTWM